MRVRPAAVVAPGGASVPITTAAGYGFRPTRTPEPRPQVTSTPAHTHPHIQRTQAVVERPVPTSLIANHTHKMHPILASTTALHPHAPGGSATSSVAPAHLRCAHHCPYARPCRPLHPSSHPHPRIDVTARASSSSVGDPSSSTTSSPAPRPPSADPTPTTPATAAATAASSGDAGPSSSGTPAAALTAAQSAPGGSDAARFTEDVTALRRAQRARRAQQAQQQQVTQQAHQQQRQQAQQQADAGGFGGSVGVALLAGVGVLALLFRQAFAGKAREVAQSTAQAISSVGPGEEHAACRACRALCVLCAVHVGHVVAFRCMLRHAGWVCVVTSVSRQ